MPAKYDTCIKSQNRVCGDNLEFYLSWDSSGRAESVNWDGDGCALSVSSASLFTEFIKGKTKEQIKKIKPSAIMKLLKMKDLNPSRTKCALLPLESVQNI
jgi:NifU-like protein involved in Fe-S cluster formation